MRRKLTAKMFRTAYVSKLIVWLSIYHKTILRTAFLLTKLTLVVVKIHSAKQLFRGFMRMDFKIVSKCLIFLSHMAKEEYVKWRKSSKKRAFDYSF